MGPQNTHRKDSTPVHSMSSNVLERFFSLLSQHICLRHHYCHLAFVSLICLMAVTAVHTFRLYDNLIIAVDSLSADKFLSSAFGQIKSMHFKNIYSLFHHFVIIICPLYFGELNERNKGLRNQLTNQPTNHSLNQSINQSINQSFNQSINQSIDMTVSGYLQ